MLDNSSTRFRETGKVGSLSPAAVADRGNRATNCVVPKASFKVTKDMLFDTFLFVEFELDEGTVVA